jgi:hypothetical protein
VTRATFFEEAHQRAIPKPVTIAPKDVMTVRRTARIEVARFV